jgi:hypothetical protein
MAFLRLEELHAEFIDAYHQWANAERPKESMESLSMLYNPEYLERYATFRSSKWERYIAARDAFLEERKRIFTAFPDFQKVYHLPKRN